MCSLTSWCRSWSASLGQVDRVQRAPACGAWAPNNSACSCCACGAHMHAGRGQMGMHTGQGKMDVRTGQGCKSPDLSVSGRVKNTSSLHKSQAFGCLRGALAGCVSSMHPSLHGQTTALCTHKCPAWRLPTAITQTQPRPSPPIPSPQP